MKKQIKISFFFTAISTVFLGVVYHTVLSIIGLVLPSFSGPNLLTKPIEREDLFHGRPSMSGGPYSGGSNLALTSEALSKQVDERVKKLSKDAPGVLIPRDLLFASGSGYDPHISPEAAKFQIPRIANARHLDAQVLHQLVEKHVVKKLWGFVGADQVDVVALNAALENMKTVTSYVGP